MECVRFFCHLGRVDGSTCSVCTVMLESTRTKSTADDAKRFIFSKRKFRSLDFTFGGRAALIRSLLGVVWDLRLTSLVSSVGSALS